LSLKFDFGCPLPISVNAIAIHSTVGHPNPSEAWVMRSPTWAKAKMRASLKRIDLATMKIDLPLFDGLLRLEPEIKQFLPGQDFDWLDAIGIRLENLANLKNGGYYCTPTNTLAFASTGMDGEHFSFLLCNDEITPDSPVILTAPCSYDGLLNAVVAKDFRTFLCLGLRYGYFALGEIAYNPKEAIQIYTNAHWQPTEKHHCSIYRPKEQHQKIQTFIARALDLQPYVYKAEEFTTLQDRFMPLLSMSDEYYELCGD
jgi:hypothetical protein